MAELVEAVVLHHSEDQEVTEVVAEVEDPLSEGMLVTAEVVAMVVPPLVASLEMVVAVVTVVFPLVELLATVGVAELVDFPLVVSPVTVGLAGLGEQLLQFSLFQPERSMFPQLASVRHVLSQPQCQYAQPL
jgi:hypothetical protein